MAMLVDVGVEPGALPMTSIVVRPRCRVAVPANTPFPTAAGRPWICTTAFAGLTVPRTVMLPAAVALPPVGEVSFKLTALGAAVPGVVDPQPASATRARIPTAKSPIALATGARREEFLCWAWFA
jgi:hypothetical protein